ncbi:MAG: TonB-dependent receptor plug domain-containing protein [Sphingorhabdus sp.]|uniref:TonB-dependent receptor plug domain-containing protein n=1 Tax=Sphingorhabdus sp. TaxID=1902408 RepID=UPI0038FCD15D
MKLLKYSAAALALSPVCVFAQDANEDIVVTASGFEQPRSETGQAISVLDNARLEELQANSIIDALRTLPGVAIATRGPVGSQSSVFLRGGNSSQTLVLIDGVRINDPSSPNAAFDFGALLTGNVGRVEVLRGPNSIIWGSQAIGGVVNVQSLSPTQALAVNAGAEYGFADTLRANANLSGTSGLFEGSIGGAFYRTDGISALAGGAEKDGFENWAANGRLKVNVAENFALDFRGYYNRGTIEFDSPFGVGADGLPVARNRQFIGYVGANFDLADGRFQNRVSYARTDITRVGTDPVVFSFNNFDVKGTIDRFEYHSAFDVTDAVTLVFGADHERTFASTSFEGAPADIARNQVTSGFGQLIVRPVTGLTITGGVRHDDYSDYGGQTTLGGNIAYTPNGGDTVLRATYGEGFRAPTLSEGQPPFGNPNLKPETARNFDLGLEHRFLDNNAQVYATYFNRKSSDLIAFSFTTFQSENIDQVDTDGIEVGFALQPTDGLNIQANYTLTNAINRSAGANLGNRLALRPQHSGSLTIDWQTPWRLKLGASVLLAGDSFDNASNSVRLDGYTLAHLRASYPLNDQLELYGRVENLFDTQYVQVAGFNTYGRNAHFGIRAKF